MLASHGIAKREVRANEYSPSAETRQLPSRDLEGRRIDVETE